MRNRLLNILALLQNVETKGASTDYLYLAKLDLAQICDEMAVDEQTASEGKKEKKSK